MREGFRIPLEFIEKATALGYFDGEGMRSVMEQAYADLEREVQLFAVANGFSAARDGFRIWARKGEETYLLAAAAGTDDDPMNIWAMAFQRMELILDTDFPGQVVYPAPRASEVRQGVLSSARGNGPLA